jgi:hypothetical protein
MSVTKAIYNPNTINSKQEYKEKKRDLIIMEAQVISRKYFLSYYSTITMLDINVEIREEKHKLKLLQEKIDQLQVSIAEYEISNL